MTADSPQPPQPGWPAGAGGSPPVPYPPGPPPAPPKKRSIGKRILTVLGALVLVIAAKLGLGAVRNHIASDVADGFDYDVGTCLEIKAAITLVSPGDVHAAPCSSPAALVKVAKKYNGARDCPNDNYGTLEGGGTGLCLQDNLVVGNCYQQRVITHFFESTACTPGVVDPTVRVALRHDGVDDAGLCTGDLEPMTFPEPPLTYCLEVLQANS